MIGSLFGTGLKIHQMETMTILSIIKVYESFTFRRVIGFVKHSLKVN